MNKMELHNLFMVRNGLVNKIHRYEAEASHDFLVEQWNEELLAVEKTIRKEEGGV